MRKGLRKDSFIGSSRSHSAKDLQNIANFTVLLSDARRTDSCFLSRIVDGTVRYKKLQNWMDEDT